jgi:hypothetical protein
MLFWRFAIKGTQKLSGSSHDFLHYDECLLKREAKFFYFSTAERSLWESI